jgi:hypothetical protein
MIRLLLAALTASLVLLFVGVARGGKSTIAAGGCDGAWEARMDACRNARCVQRANDLHGICEGLAPAEGPTCGKPPRPPCQPPPKPVPKGA